MIFFKKLLARWAAEGTQAYEYNGEPLYTSATSAANAKRPYNGESRGEEFKNPMNITLYNAMGGRIIKFHSYNRKLEQSQETTYIVPSDEDFESALGQFITIEAMKHTNNE